MKYLESQITLKGINNLVLLCKLPVVRNLTTEYLRARQAGSLSPDPLCLNLYPTVPLNSYVFLVQLLKLPSFFIYLIIIITEPQKTFVKMKKNVKLLAKCGGSHP